METRDFFRATRPARHTPSTSTPVVSSRDHHPLPRPPAGRGAPAAAPPSLAERLCDCLCGGGLEAAALRREAAALRAALREARAAEAAARERLAAEGDWAAVDAAGGRLARQYECRLCFARPIGAVLLPCGHALCCAGCAAGLAACPACRCALEGATPITYL